MKFFFVAVWLNFMFCSNPKVYLFAAFQCLCGPNYFIHAHPMASEQFGVVFAVSVAWHLKRSTLILLMLKRDMAIETRNKRH